MYLEREIDIKHSNYLNNQKRVCICTVELQFFPQKVSEKLKLLKA